MSIIINNPSDTPRYFQLHEMPPDDFHAWTEEQQKAWAENSLKKNPVVTLGPYSKTKIDVPSYSTGIKFSKKK